MSYIVYENTKLIIAVERSMRHVALHILLW